MEDGEQVHPGKPGKSKLKFMLDTASIKSILKDAIPLDEWRRTSPELRAAKIKAQPEADKVRRRYIKQTITTLKTEGFDVKPKVIEDAVLRRVLAPEFVLYPADKPPVTVADVLADPETWDRERFADPLEPDYADDPRIAVAMLSDGKACIYSHAHGGQTFALGSAFRVIDGGRKDADGGDTDGGWQCTPDGAVLHNEHNFLRALALEGVALRHNEFAHEDEMIGFPGHGPQLTDVAEISLWLQIWKRHKLKFKKEDFRDLVAATAFRNRVHPVRQYLNEAAESWDKEPRIDKWLHTYLGAEDNAANSFIGRIWLIAAVRRVRQPGCKFDYMPVLEGPQGTSKSSAVRALCHDPAWFTDSLTLSATIKETAEVTAGLWIVEVSELGGMRKAEVESVKSLLTRQSDRARMAFCRRGETRLRQFVAVGTTNQDNYLLDRTGNRRFLPVKCGRIDIAQIVHDRDQLWGEAAHREAEGERIYPTDKELEDALKAAQEQREVVDEWNDKVAAWLTNRSKGMRLADVAEGVLKITIDRFDPVSQKRVADCMRNAGWECKLRQGRGWWTKKKG